MAVELETFVGEWRDSMGNHVRVDWSWPGNRGGQLDVVLSKSGRDPIKLNVKRLSDGRFTCGHYDLDVDQSDSRRVVWLDAKNRKNRSVWEREGEPPDPSERSRGSWSQWRDKSWHARDWDEAGKQSDDRSWRRHRSRSNGRAARKDWGHRDASWHGRSAERRPSRRSWDSRERDGHERDNHGDSKARDSPNGFEQCREAVPSSNSCPGIVAPLPVVPPQPCSPWGHGPWMAPGVIPPLMQPAPPQPQTSVWSGAPTPGAWVPPTTAPPPMVQTQGYDWRPIIEEMYRRYNPTKLSELSSILDKYRGNEADLYRALCEKYGPLPDWKPFQPQPLPQAHAPGALPSADLAPPPGDWYGPGSGREVEAAPGSRGAAPELPGLAA